GGVRLPCVYEGDAAAPVTVATFTQGTGGAPASAFTATVDWGIPEHAADPAGITQNSDGSYTVTALRPVFLDNGAYAVAVSVSHVGVPGTLVTARVPQNATISSVLYGGTGSPAGSVGQSFSADRQVATLIYDQF